MLGIAKKIFGSSNDRKVKDFIQRAHAAAPPEYQGEAEFPYDWLEDE